MQVSRCPIHALERPVDSPGGVKLGNQKVEYDTWSFRAAADEAMWERAGGGSTTSLTSWGLTALDVVPAALCPVPEVCGGDDQIQRGPGGLPGTQQRADPAAARNQYVSEASRRPFTLS